MLCRSVSKGHFLRTDSLFILARQRFMNQRVTDAAVFEKLARKRETQHLCIPLDEVGKRRAIICYTRSTGQQYIATGTVVLVTSRSGKIQADSASCGPRYDALARVTEASRCKRSYSGYCQLPSCNTEASKAGQGIDVLGWWRSLALR